MPDFRHGGECFSPRSRGARQGVTNPFARRPIIVHDRPPHYPQGNGDDMDHPDIIQTILYVLAACGAALVAGAFLPSRPAALASVYGAPDQAGHMPSLEMYRGVLALAVALSHAMAFPLLREHETLGGLMSLDGRKAVAFFCVISGFVIFRSCRNLGASQEALRNYAVRRALRILPVLFLAIALSLLVTNNVDLALVASEFSLIGIFGLDSVSTANPTLWSVYPEILFYGLAPIIVALSGRNRVAFFLIAACIIALGDRATESHGVHVWKYFMLGMAISALDLSIGHLVTRGKRAAAAAAGASLIAADLVLGDLVGSVWAAVGAGPREDAEGGSLASVFSLGLGIGCALMVLGTVRSATANGIASLPVFRWLGAVSYPFFVLHQVVYMTAFGWQFEAPRSFSGDGAVTAFDDPVLAVVTILLATLALGTAVHLAVEKPFMRLGRRIGNPKPVAPALEAGTAASAA